MDAISSQDPLDKRDVDLTDGKFDYGQAYDQMKANIYQEELFFTPEKTLYYLRKWYYLMTLREPADDKQIEHKKKVIRLINASIITPSKCSSRSYDEIKSLFQTFQSQVHNIIPYLKEQRRRLYDFCESLLDDMLKIENKTPENWPNTWS